jgi:hypothetical protein
MMSAFRKRQGSVIAVMAGLGLVRDGPGGS